MRYALAGSTMVGMLLWLAPAGADDKEPAVVLKTYTYKTVDQVELKADVFRPADDVVRPVVVHIHGGALIMGNRNLTSKPGSLVDALLKAGYVVVSIDYRKAPAVKLPAIVADVQDACQWVRSKGPELFKIDPKKMAVMGGSAGGYLTQMTGFRVEPRPVALVSFWGYGDIAGAWYSRPDAFYRKQPLVSKEEANKEGGPRLYLYLRQQGLWPKELTGHDPDAEPKAFDPFCPLRNVTKDYPPTLLIHGDKDTDVPYEQSVLMAKELKGRGVVHEFITIPDGGHGLGKTSAAEIAKIYEQVVAFLNKQMK